MLDFARSPAAGSENVCATSQESAGIRVSRGKWLGLPKSCGRLEKSTGSECYKVKENSGKWNETRKRFPSVCRDFLFGPFGLPALDGPIRGQASVPNLI